MKLVVVALLCAFSVALAFPKQEDDFPEEDPSPIKGVPYYPKGHIGKKGVPVTINGIMRVKGGCGLYGHKGLCKGYGGLKGRLMLLRMHGVMVPLGYGYGHGIGLGHGRGLGLGLGKGIGLGGLGGLGLGKGFGYRGHLHHKGKK